MNPHFDALHKRSQAARALALESWSVLPACGQHVTVVLWRWGDESGARLRQTGVGSGSVALPLGNWEDVTPSVWGRDPTRVSRRRPAGREMGVPVGSASPCASVGAVTRPG